MKKVLIIDDEKLVRESYSEALGSYDFSPVEAENAQSAFDLYKNEDPSVVLLDLKMPDINGLEVLQRLKEIDPHIPIIMVTAHGDIQTAVEAIKLGAYDFIVKPPEFNKLVLILQRAIESLELKKQVENSFEFLIGKDPAMKQVMEQIHRVAKRDISVILQGETGTGKTFIASIIHNLSKRAANPFVRVDIGSITESLVENELFGHEKGSYTGAGNQKTGYFEKANAGTIFIDELENMSSHIQTKFLRIVEDNQLFRIGSTSPVELDIRYITATNTDIKKSVMDKKFREDLFYRLAEFIINIPPLRNRPKDITFFAHKFLLEATSHDVNKHVKELSENALKQLQDYSWPGNIRELKTVIKRAVIFCDEHTIRREHIKFFDQTKDLPANNSEMSITPLKERVKDLEINAIKEVLSYSKGNKSKAATLLQIDYTTLLRKLKDYQIK